jgi:DNA-binding CsgD family transcriptional regulator
MRGRPLTIAEQTLVKEMRKTLSFRRIGQQLDLNVKTVKKYVNAPTQVNT